MRYVLALDQGTTSSRAIVFDEHGVAVAAAQGEFEQHFPQPGWVEHDPKEIYRTQRETAREAVRKSNVSLKEMVAVGITNQRETTLLWDRQSGEPLHRAIVWQDRRTAPLCQDLRAAGAESLVRERTGLVIDPYFSGTKLTWLLDNVPGARARAERGELAFGTGCFMLMHTGDRVVQSQNGLVSTACAQIREKEYALEGSVFIAGAVVQWLRDQLQFFASSAEVEKLAASVLDSGDVFLVPAFTGLGAPYWDANARGALIGITRGTSRAHIARAALESIAYQSAELLDAMQKDAAQPLAELRVDGGAAANDLLMQFQADLLGVPVLRPKVLETTALGAAYLAGLTVNLWKSRHALAKHWQLDKRFDPHMTCAEAQAKLARWREAVSRARNWAKVP